MIEIFIGLGANIGDARATVLAAFDDCRAMPDTLVTGTSSLYRSEPVDSPGSDYVNAVLAARTSLSPLLLLAALQRIEARHGRRRPFPNAPRTLDLDLLLYDQQIIDLPGLKVPHPRMHQRAFVLKPLLELAPLVAIPGLGTAEHWLAEAAAQRVERLPD